MYILHFFFFYDVCRAQTHVFTKNCEISMKSMQVFDNRNNFLMSIWFWAWSKFQASIFHTWVTTHLAYVFSWKKNHWKNAEFMPVLKKLFSIPYPEGNKSCDSTKLVPCTISTRFSYKWTFLHYALFTREIHIVNWIKSISFKNNFSD